MAWTTEDRRRYAPAIQEMVPQGMLARVAATIDAIHRAAPVGRPRVWPTLVMLRALWHVARDDRAWRRRLPPDRPGARRAFQRGDGAAQLDHQDGQRALAAPPRRERLDLPAPAADRKGEAGQAGARVA